MKAYLRFWRGYTDFTGKTSCSEFWQAFVIHMVVSTVLVFVFHLVPLFVLSLDVETTIRLFNIIWPIYGALWLIPFIAMIVRRLRDAGYSAKSFFWLLIPGIGMIALLARLFAKSTE